MMKRIALLLASVLVAILTITASDEPRVFTVETVPNTHVADRRQYVSDPEGLLSAAARDTISALFARLKAETGIETAVVVVPSIGESDPFEFSQSLFQHWGIGRKSNNNGLLILYVEDRHIIRFHTGYGIEGFLTDAKSKRIQTRYMVPAFKRGNRDAGMVAGSQAVCETLKGSMNPEAQDDSGDSLFGIIFLLGAIVFFIILANYNSRRSRKCPHCGNVALRHKSTDYYRSPNGQRMRKDIYICSHCGRVTVRNTKVDDNDDRGSGLGSFLGGYLIGSLLSGGRGGGGGGFGGGGSFGGGSSGGGGASSSW